MVGVVLKFPYRLFLVIIIIFCENIGGNMGDAHRGEEVGLN